MQQLFASPCHARAVPVGGHVPCVGFLAVSPGTSVAITPRLLGKLTWVSQRGAPELQA